MSTSKRRILIVEDEPLMSALLQQSLTSADFEVEAAIDAAQARKKIEAFDPDILLLDISLGDGPSGLHLAHAIDKTRPDIAILILTKHPDAKSATSEGLDIPPRVGFLRKHLVNDVNYLLNAIEKVLSDRSSEVRQDFQSESPINKLSEQAVLILSLIAQGFSNNEIAIRTKLSVKSVERWIDIIYKELEIAKSGEINQRVEAARRYYMIVGIPERSAR
ncbi:MAG: response regulator [Candidatus Nanopelagicales bacterium]